MLHYNKNDWYPRSAKKQSLVSTERQISTTALIIYREKALPAIYRFFPIDNKSLNVLRLFLITHLLKLTFLKYPLGKAISRFLFHSINCETLQWVIVQASRGICQGLESMQ